MFACKKTERCINCNSHYKRLRPLVKEIIVCRQFKKDLPGFNPSYILECKHIYKNKSHKFEAILEGNHIFRALKNQTHIVYVIDQKHRLILLRAFENFNAYQNFLNDKKKILEMIKRAFQE